MADEQSSNIDTQTGLNLDKFVKPTFDEVMNDDTSEEVVAEEVSEEEAPAEAEAEEESSEPEAEAEVAAEGDESAEEILDDQEIAEVTQESIKRLLLKIDGEEIEEELPFELPKEAEEYMRKQLQLAKVSQKRMQQTAEVEKNFSAFLKQFQDDPEFLMREYGIDTEEFAEAIIERQLTEMQKSPEQKAKEAAEKAKVEKDRELEEMRKKLEEMENEKKKQEAEAQHAQLVEETDKEIGDALERSGKLPNDSDTRAMVANQWYQFAAAGKNVSVDDVVTQVYMKQTEQFQKAIELLPDEALEEFFGKKVNDRIKKKYNAKKKTPPTPVNKQVKDSVTSRDIEVQKKKEIDLRDWLKHGSGTLADLAKKS